MPRKTNHSKSILAIAIYNFRKDRNMTQTELAKAIGTSKAHIGQMENQMAEKGNKISHPIYESLQMAGFNFNENLLEFSNRGGKKKENCIRKSDFSINLSKQNPEPLLEKAIELAKKATDIIKRDKEEIDRCQGLLNDRKSQIEKLLEKFKEEIINL